MLSLKNHKRPVVLRLCSPRGFCAGVERAIQIVVLVLRKYGKPVYVRHEIVHNRYVVEGLRNIGAVFVEHLDEIPQEHKNRPVIFSAHGVPESVMQEAKEQNFITFDATCPLVSKVHKQALRHYRLGRHVLLIGHEKHPEVIGTMGQLPEGAVTLIQTLLDVDNFSIDPSKPLGYISQTTLSVEDTALIVERLQKRFPNIVPPSAQSICYATTNRQESVKKAAFDVDVFFIVGAENSSNSQRLVEAAKRSGAKQARLVQGASDISWEEIETLSLFGLSAGASAPEVLIFEIIDAFKERFDVQLDLSVCAVEEENFPVMPSLRDIPLTKEDMAFVHGPF